MIGFEWITHSTDLQEMLRGWAYIFLITGMFLGFYMGNFSSSVEKSSKIQQDPKIAFLVDTRFLKGTYLLLWQ